MVDNEKRVGTLVIKAARDNWVYDLFFGEEDEILIRLYRKDISLNFILNPKKDEIEYDISDDENNEELESGILTIEECVLKIEEYIKTLN